MRRDEHIKFIFGTLSKDDLVICANGAISRECYLYDRPQNFYMLGSMGKALSIGIGVAMNTKKDVYVIDGDGNVLMNLNALALAGSLKLKNLHHLILDNGVYGTTGNQPRCKADLRKIAEACGHRVLVFPCSTETIETKPIPLSPTEIKERFMKCI